MKPLFRLIATLLCGLVSRRACRPHPDLADELDRVDTIIEQERRQREAARRGGETV